MEIKKEKWFSAIIIAGTLALTPFSAHSDARQGIVNGNAENTVGVSQHANHNAPQKGSRSTFGDRKGMITASKNVTNEAVKESLDAKNEAMKGSPSISGEGHAFGSGAGI